jgi:hypothetical protein
MKNKCWRGGYTNEENFFNRHLTATPSNRLYTLLEVPWLAIDLGHWNLKDT